MLDIKNMVINKELNYDPTANTTRLQRWPQPVSSRVPRYSIFILSKNIVVGDALTLNQPDSDDPIVFAEWSAVNGSMIKRRDYTLANLLKAEAAKGENDLFEQTYESDPAFLPRTVAEYPLTHFLKLSGQDG